MSMLDKVTKAFALSDVSKQDRAKAQIEREIQLREFDQKVADRYVDDVNEERAKVAQEHLEPGFRPAARAHRSVGAGQPGR